ncbi:MAG TPA: bifunctional phosphoribosylaminoimidazolecarboxamide formyltransferase/IMP cyclohydrolase [Acidimicrobiales bacterium]|jgi:phosphoribosylaminoimidazolecarboxamide formyltransferase/IMP cyclohydrolase
MRVPRALFSVHDKTGVVELARGLAALGWELVASRSTAAALRDAGLEVLEVGDLTGVPPILGHRVVTLHPKIHGGLLGDRDNPEHLAEMAEYGIEPIDLVVSNLYPFRQEPGIELIDIGGPTLVRAAAKNHAHVGVVVDPSGYEPVLDEIRQDGGLSAATRRRLAAEAFASIAAYDAEIAEWFGSQDEPGELPPSQHLTYWRAPLELRYGENPHQRAAVYRADGASPWWASMVQHGGLALSYLNLYDADAAWLMVHDLAQRFGQPAAVIVKHANPCGAAVAGTLADAYQHAFECDERSAFGGIVAVSEPLDAETTERMVAAAQADVVIAPGYAEGTIDALQAKRKRTRLLEASPPQPDAWHLRPVTGGLLVQEQHRFVADRADWRVVTSRQPTDAEWADADLAWRMCGWVKSNAIVLAKDGTAWGIGAGQQNRVEAGILAAQKAAGRAAGGACASDAFYPFPDGIEAAADAGVGVVIQPGGGIHDDGIIARADELGLAMVFTGERHFYH